MSRRSFDRAASGYDKHALLQQRVARTLFDHIAKEAAVTEPSSILDLGCGTGQVTEQLCDNFLDAQVVSLDFSQKMLLQTEKRLSHRGFNSSAVCADAEQLPFQEGFFDLIASSLMLQWANDLEATLKDLCGLLTDQGVLAFSSFSEGTLKEIKESWGVVDKAIHSSDFLNLDTFEPIARKAGFTKVTVVPETIVMCYPTIREMLLEVKGIGASNTRLDRGKGLTGKQRFDSFERAFEAQRLPNGTYPCTWEVTYVLCAK